MDIDHIRREYRTRGLRRSELQADPIVQFKLWLQQAIEAGLKDPTAMTLATVDADAQPSQRIVLLKEIDELGFVFFTNYKSKKARDIEINSRVNLHFPWHDLDREVSVSGIATKVSTVESQQYFASRPRDSQLAAWASKQSEVIESRQVLLDQFQKLREQFDAGDVPLPDFWGGYRVQASRIEFWQGRENRLHDRFEYILRDGRWHSERLSP